MSNKPTGELYVISAASGTGKTSLIAALLERCPQLALSVSDTTRPARRGEIDGQHYHFIDAEDFRQGIAQQRYLEHAEVYGNYYGTSRERVEQAWASGRDVLLEIDVQGAEQVRQAFPDAALIFILPPSMATLEARLKGRGLDEPAVVQRRLDEARGEIAACEQFDWLLINDDFDRAVDDLEAVIAAWPLRRRRGIGHARCLLDAETNPITIKD
ncbi:guanylate kinase [Wenzhouxiangella sp. AB-CW3]|uniref:guanylate kinase n=1 Tax=Wenzhouxiangella sp. AB-CW3 TaxID=2771012 RepID=UPI00168B74EC|nr:guanylate kinase [Wenzhouxiangella sp. AB-CW3]QOC22812.1 guanylate kinase [Wenzhouxiangella sp. AB-CW3]